MDKVLKGVVISSIGLLCPLGACVEEALLAIEGGRCAFETFSLNGEDVLISPVREEIVNRTPPFKYRRYLSPWGMFVLYAATWALEHGGIDPGEYDHMGLFLGVGPNTEVLGGDGLSQALALLKVIPNTPTCIISELFGIHGENLTITNACTSSLQAVGEGFRRIRYGTLSLAMCGGGDSRLNPWGLELYNRAHVLFHPCDTPPLPSYAPFDVENQGFVPGEGAAILILEERERAYKRGDFIWGEVLGYGSTIAGKGPTAPLARGLIAALSCALEEAGLEGGEIDVVFAHGTGTPLNDMAEIEAISSVLSADVPICALKSWIGHLSAGCGGVELSLALGCVMQGWLPPIRNLKHPRDGTLHFVTKREEINLPANVLIQNMGFGGHNAALIIRVGELTS